MGRKGSRTLRLPIQLPLIPSISRMRGPAQQAEAVRPAITPAMSVTLVPLLFFIVVFSKFTESSDIGSIIGLI